MKRLAQFEIFLDAQKQYRWRFRASNGEPVAQSEGYTTKENARKTIEMIQGEAAGAAIVEINV